MDNKDFSRFESSNENIELNSLESVNDKGVEGEAEAVLKIQELSNGKKQEELTDVTMPPVGEEIDRLKDIGQDAKKVELIGKDGKITNGELNVLMSEIDAMSGDPARLSVEVEKLSKEIRG